MYGGFQDYRDALACYNRLKEDIDLVELNKKAIILGCKDILDAIVEKTPVDQIFPDD